MTNIIMNSVTSSNIEAIGYSPIDKLLRVEFKTGKTYEYYDVGQNQAQAFMDAPSKGKFFNANIKDAYGFAEI